MTNSCFSRHFMSVCWFVYTHAHSTYNMYMPTHVHTYIDPRQQPQSDVLCSEKTHWFKLSVKLNSPAMDIDIEIPRHVVYLEHDLRKCWLVRSQGAKDSQAEGLCWRGYSQGTLEVWSCWEFSETVWNLLQLFPLSSEKSELSQLKHSIVSLQNVEPKL